MADDIFEYVKREEAAFALPITVPGTDWEWSMKEHIRLSTLYKYSQFSTGNSEKERDDKPFKNIVRPILNVQYRTEGFDVKDILLYVDNEEKFFMSFLTKKYHDRWAIVNKIDTFIDDVCESVVDYGGALIRDVSKKAPEHIPLTKIAFCDQSNMLGGPIGIKHFFSPDELQKFESRGWGNPNNGADVTIEEAIILAKNEKVNDAQNGKADRTPGKYIECYEVNGMLPESWYKKDGNPDKYVRQMQILMYYTDENGKKQGLKLYAGRAKEGTFKVALRDKIVGRALGFGGVEELFDAQVWANYDEMAMLGLLDAATKIVLQSTDPTIRQKHPTGLKGLENLEVIDVDDGKQISQVNTSPANFGLFEKATNRWDQIARTIGSAQDVLQGENPTSGEPFRTTSLVTQNALGLHDYRRGKYAAFIGGEVYPDWVLLHLSQDLVKGKKFLETLSLKELQKVAADLVTCETNKVIKDKILNGQEIIPADIERVRAGIHKQFMGKGLNHFMEIFEGEMKDVPLVVRVSVDGKQKDLAKITDKLVNIVRQIIAAPQILQYPGMADLFNEIIEYSGLSPIDFSLVPPQATQPAPTPSPVVPTKEVAPTY